VAEAEARQQADGVLQQNIDAVNGSWNQAVGDEAAARAGADNTLDGKISAEAQTRASADNTLDGKISAEAQARASADTALWDFAGELDANKAEKQALADFEREVAEDYAPLDSPHFTGVPTVPSPAEVNYGEPMQALPVQDFLELFNLTMGTSGILRRMVDTDAVTDEGTPACLPYERILDRDDGVRDEYREVDADGRDCATEKQFWELYLFVLGTMQIELRTLDTDGRPGDFGFDFRKLDVEEGAKPEIRELDADGGYIPPYYDDYMALADCYWVDAVSGAREKGAASGEYLDLADCYWVDAVSEATTPKKGAVNGDFLRLSLCWWEDVAAAVKNMKIPAELNRLGTLEEKMKQMEMLVKKLTGEKK
jgi:hypothetical protein